MKKNPKRWIVTFILLFIIGFPLFIYDALKGNPLRDLLMEKATKEQLLIEGYNKSDWVQVQGSYNMKRNTNRIKGTIATVIFKDEPGEKYLYIQWRNSGKIQQSCEYFNPDTNAYEVKYSTERKHMVRDCY
ncbi:hypothetical protein JOC86_004569 [Bacillus pakistanensis]|uniref:DUF3139 domain-containing protein n=1 Tax=Rossellomorea pakistanensis TaxID=992288 RepID=A0ABS2NJG2_9BACI|nr:DUF3139 domain-containing protein [Bacillus pakistanensis]MBM7587994.1 hypothetical protein [Bacillus pakistanensis]